ncbi:MAG: phosphonate C-P lyase system protein PhnK [Desulfosoma sp.]
MASEAKKSRVPFEASMRFSEEKEKPINGDGRPEIHDFEPILQARNLTHLYGGRVGCQDVDVEVMPGEVLAVVGESGSGKSTLLRCLCGLQVPTKGQVLYRHHQEWLDLYQIDNSLRRRLLRTAIGVVFQNPQEGLRMHVSAGGNISERLLAEGERRYSQLRRTACWWMERVELDVDRVDDPPGTYSGGMLQRLQIAKNLASNPRIVFLDEPTSGLDVSVQARFLDVMRRLVRELKLSVVMVTHDLAVARVLAHRLMVMVRGQVVEQGLMDRILDDPQHPYTQLLVASRLTA